jgi:hypothetical protein
MLNPSTATAEQDDPTIRRCLRYAREWGYPALVVTNLYALRSTDPEAVRTLPGQSDALRRAAVIGPDNDWHIQTQARAAGLVLCAWGARAERPRVHEVLRLLEGLPLFVLGFTRRTAEPCHPLYQRAALRPRAWSIADLIF